MGPSSMGQNSQLLCKNILALVNLVYPCNTWMGIYLNGEHKRLFFPFSRDVWLAIASPGITRLDIYWLEIFFSHSNILVNIIYIKSDYIPQFCCALVTLCNNMSISTMSKAYADIHIP